MESELEVGPPHTICPSPQPQPPVPSQPARSPHPPVAPGFPAPLSPGCSGRWPPPRPFTCSAAESRALARASPAVTPLGPCPGLSSPLWP